MTAPFGLSDFEQRLGRLLKEHVRAITIARNEFASKGAEVGHHAWNSSRFRIGEGEIARLHFPVGVDTALAELDAAKKQNAAIRHDLRSATETHLRTFLDDVGTAAMPPFSGAFGKPVPRPIPEVMKELGELLTTILREYDLGLHSPKVVSPSSVTNLVMVHGRVDLIQQAGGDSRQLGRSTTTDDED